MNSSISQFRRVAFLFVCASAASFAAAGDEPPHFPLGVAAGDVRTESAIIWTRTDAPGAVRLDLSRNPDFDPVEQSLSADADAATDLTVKIQVIDLLPNTAYWYRFTFESAPAEPSRTGRFHTIPPPDDPAPFRFVFSGDTNYAFAPFNVMGQAVVENSDLFIWFGDTIYGDVTAGGLGPAVRLADYRAKYVQVRSDSGVRALLAQTATWAGGDDHEVTNDYAGGDPALPPTQISAGYQAFFEYMPIAALGPAGDRYRTYRSFRYGRNAEFFILDERQYREPSAVEACNAALDPSGFVSPLFYSPRCLRALAERREMLGAAQFDWLTSALKASTARVKFVVNNVPISYIGLYPFDRWDGYDYQRRKLLEFIDANRIEGVVFLTTDIHANFFNPDITRHFRANRPEYHLANRVPIAEVVTGPLGNETLLGTVRAAIDGVFGESTGEDWLTPGHALRILADIEVNRLKRISGFTFVDLDKVSYLVVDVSADAEVTLRYRGLPQALAERNTAEDPEPAGPPAPPVETVYETRLSDPPASPSLPCALPVLVVSATGYFCLRRRFAR